MRVSAGENKVFFLLAGIVYYTYFVHILNIQIHNTLTRNVRKVWKMNAYFPKKLANTVGNRELLPVSVGPETRRYFLYQINSIFRRVSTVVQFHLNRR